MITRSEYAAYVEFDDFIVTDADTEATARVIHISDSGDSIVFCVEDEDGERTDMVFPPFRTVTIVESFLNGDEADGETVFIEL